MVSAFKKLQNMKAAGVDGNTAECFNAATILYISGSNACRDFLLAPYITSLSFKRIHGDFPECFAINILTQISKAEGTLVT